MADPLDSPHIRKLAAPAKVLDSYIQNRLRWENDAFRVYSRNTFYAADQHALYILESNLSREHKPHERVILQKATPRWTTQVLPTPCRRGAAAPPNRGEAALPRIMEGVAAPPPLEEAGLLGYTRESQRRLLMGGGWQRRLLAGK